MAVLPFLFHQALGDSEVTLQNENFNFPFTILTLEADPKPCSIYSNPFSSHDSGGFAIYDPQKKHPANCSILHWLHAIILQPLQQISIPGMVLPSRRDLNHQHPLDPLSCSLGSKALWSSMLRSLTPTIIQPSGSGSDIDPAV